MFTKLPFKTHTHARTQTHTHTLTHEQFIVCFFRCVYIMCLYQQKDTKKALMYMYASVHPIFVFQAAAVNESIQPNELGQRKC